MDDWSKALNAAPGLGCLPSIMIMQRRQEETAQSDALTALSPNWARQEVAVTHSIITGLLRTRAMPLATMHLPIPDPFVGEFDELRKLRSATALRKESYENQVEQKQRNFPDLAHSVVPAAQGSKPLQSNIGILAKLPGEIRNRIYRMLCIAGDKAEPMKVEMTAGTCAQGRCLHSTAKDNVSSIANTCRQLRWEVMTIFCGENKTFRFDDGMVLHNCVGNFLRSLGDYADLIREYQLILKRPIWNRAVFVKWATYVFTLTTPQASPSGTFALSYVEEDNRAICKCKLDPMVDEMTINATRDKMPLGKVVEGFVESEELADYLWRMRASKGWWLALLRCEACDKVVFP